MCPHLGYAVKIICFILGQFFYKNKEGEYVDELWRDHTAIRNLMQNCAQ